MVWYVHIATLLILMPLEVMIFFVGSENKENVAQLYAAILFSTAPFVICAVGLMLCAQVDENWSGAVSTHTN